MQIVTAGIIEKDGKILIAKRKKGKCLEAKWEFPGGKLEPLESPKECLKRELLEELSVETEIKDYVCSSIFYCGNNQIELMAFMVAFISGEINLVDHEDYRWVSIEEIEKFDFVEPDIPIVKKLIELKTANKPESLI